MNFNCVVDKVFTFLKVFFLILSLKVIVKTKQKSYEFKQKKHQKSFGGWAPVRTHCVAYVTCSSQSSSDSELD